MLLSKPIADHPAAFFTSYQRYEDPDGPLRSIEDWINCTPPYWPTRPEGIHRWSRR